MIKISYCIIESFVFGTSVNIFLGSAHKQTEMFCIIVNLCRGFFHVKKGIVEPCYLHEVEL